jgi:KamA family protein
MSGPEADDLDRVAERFAFKTNSYYLGLIDWDDPDDPIRRLVIPHPDELRQWGSLDASNEAANTVARGLQHKYADTALYLAADTCAAYCRFCFRKRLFMRENQEIDVDPEPALAYVREHREIRDVLVTGGDPLVLATSSLARVVEGFASIDHVRTIRVGSKTPAFLPHRILADRNLLDMFTRVAESGTALYLMAHFDHPRELTSTAREAVAAIQATGTQVLNQCPLVRGVNDDPAVLTELFETATTLGMPQYYLFQGRPAAGNRIYSVRLTQGWRIFHEARRNLSGLSRRVRYVMSHARGKFEIIGLDDDYLHLRCHRARDPEEDGRVLMARRDDRAVWLDDLELVEVSSTSKSLEWEAGG